MKTKSLHGFTSLIRLPPSTSRPRVAGTDCQNMLPQKTEYGRIISSLVEYRLRKWSKRCSEFSSRKYFYPLRSRSYFDVRLPSRMRAKPRYHRPLRMEMRFQYCNNIDISIFFGTITATPSCHQSNRNGPRVSSSRAARCTEFSPNIVKPRNIRARD